jgi:ribosomal protein S21
MFLFFKKRKQKIAFEQAERKFKKFIKECGILEELSQLPSLNINNSIDDYGLQQWEIEILTEEVYKTKVEKRKKEKEEQRKKFFNRKKTKESN